MIWHYNCPDCGREVEVRWEWHKEELTCPHCLRAHYPPTPSENHYAYIGGEAWPEDLETAVVALRGTICAVPRCYREYKTLAHRHPAAKGGRTSVDNLLPLCSHHAELMGKQDYDEWLAGLSPEEKTPEEAPIEITLTATGPRDQEAPSVPRGLALPLAGKPRSPTAIPTNMALLVCQPFPIGSIRELILHYDWRLEAEGKSRVLLLAWPHQEPPELIGAPESIKWPYTVKEHRGAAGASGSVKLDLTLPFATEARWVAGLVVIEEGGKLKLEDYLLTGTV